MSGNQKRNYHETIKNLYLYRKEMKISKICPPLPVFCRAPILPLCPTRPVRAQIPAVFRRHYETAGIAPLLKNYLKLLANQETVFSLVCLALAFFNDSKCKTPLCLSVSIFPSNRKLPSPKVFSTSRASGKSLPVKCAFKNVL